MHLDEDRLQRLADGELDRSADPAVDRHLDGCPACRERLEAARRDDDAVRELLYAVDHTLPPVTACASVSVRTRL